MQQKPDLRSLLGIEHPIIQAPMAGANTPELVAAVSNAGGLGLFGAADRTPAQIGEAVAAIRRLTDRPFGVNLFAGNTEATLTGDPQPMYEILARHHEALKIPPPSIPESAAIPFREQLDAVLDASVPIFSFTFGIPSPDQLARLRAHNVVVIGTATTVEEGRLLEEAGVQAIVAQGSEAGAHRGTFHRSFEESLIGTMALVPQMVDAVALPVIASGGIMDGRGIVAAQALGASGVQLGTAFLTCHEAGVPEAHKAAIRNARADQTALTRAFSGRPARGIVNDYMLEVHQHPETILPFPIQNSVTRPLRNAAGAQGDTRFMSLWAGQAAPLARDLPAGELVQLLVHEAAEIRARLAGA